MVLPWVPATAMPSRSRINSASICARGTTGSDHWAGFAHERGELLTYIKAEKIGGVFFLAGDQRWSAVHHHPAQGSADGGVQPLDPPQLQDDEEERTPPVEVEEQPFDHPMQRDPLDHRAEERNGLGGNRVARASVGSLER